MPTEIVDKLNKEIGFKDQSDRQRDGDWLARYRVGQRKCGTSCGSWAPPSANRRSERRRARLRRHADGCDATPLAKTASLFARLAECSNTSFIRGGGCWAALRSRSRRPRLRLTSTRARP